jgi:uncharacterized protein YjbI with pentapeptide repeats
VAPAPVEHRSRRPQRPVAGTGEPLRHASAHLANLEGANLEGATLQGANLQGANLQGVDLQYANLVGATLQDADLQGANLRGADLREVRDLTPAQLQAAQTDAQTRLPDGFTRPPP